MTANTLRGSSYAVKAGRILRVKSLTGLEKYFEIELPGREELGHMPGQFVMISVPGAGEAPISVSSSPGKKGAFELVIRRAGAVTEALHRLEAGDTVGIRGPYGRGFPVEKFKGHNLLMIGGGCGNIPLHSLITFVLENRSSFGKIGILSGFKSPEMLLFAGEFGGWARTPDLFMDLTVDRGGPGWQGKVGLIIGLISPLTIDAVKTYAVVVGPPIMYKFVIRELLKKSIPEDHIIVSMERHMKCGVGKCGHCQIAQYYCCQEGPVFTFKEIRRFYESI